MRRRKSAKLISWGEFRNAHGYTDYDEPAVFAEYMRYASKGEHVGWYAPGDVEPPHRGIRRLTQLARQFWRLRQNEERH